MKRWSLPVALAVCIFLKFILFDVIWSSDTTFQSFSQPESYLIKGAIALLLAFPTVFFRSRWYAGIVCFLLDILLVANLMYWRTYYTAIPWNSYFLAGNLADFMGSSVCIGPMVRRFVLCDDFGIVVLYFPIRGFAVESVGNETSGRMVCSGLLDLCRSDGGIDFCSRWISTVV